MRRRSDINPPSEYRGRGKEVVLPHEYRILRDRARGALLLNAYKLGEIPESMIPADAIIRYCNGHYTDQVVEDPSSPHGVSIERTMVGARQDILITNWINRNWQKLIRMSEPNSKMAQQKMKGGDTARGNFEIRDS